MDPHLVLNLPHGFTMEQLRYNYKALAKQLHPDKSGGRLSAEQANATFQVLTDAYRALLADLARRTNDKPFDALRASARDHSHSQSVTGMVPPATKDFSIDRFNRVFDKNRMNDPVADGGYGDWIRNNDPERGVPKDDAARNRQVIRYVEPVPVSMNRKSTVAFTELGVDRVDDYSRDDATRHGIQFTDYRVAHTTTRLVDEDVGKDRKGFNSMEDIKSHRANLSYAMSDEDAQAYAERLQAEKLAEARRVEQQNMYDRRLEAHFERVHRKLLGYAGTATF